MEFSKDSDEKCSRKDTELELADSIACPSTFVRNSIPEAFRHKCRLLRYGAPPPVRDVKSHEINRPLKILFAGSMSQRKGLADLFEAIKLLDTKQIELIVMGKLRAPIGFYKKQCPDFTYAPPRSHSNVLELMRSCDLFCLPSIVEGRALVQLEALSSGLPLIITPNTGGNNLIDEGETGFIVPINAPHVIAEKIDWFLAHRNIIQQMKEAAWNKAEFESWDHYRIEFIAFIKERLMVI
jgi:glycosyltransferase involved in cell wall biosynthesis